MDWNERYSSWVSASESNPEDDTAERLIERAALAAIQPGNELDTPEHWDWVHRVLDERLEPLDFLLFVLDSERIPPDLAIRLLSLGVNESNIHAAGFFTRPAVKALGAAHAMNLLFEFLRTGSNRQRRGAIELVYYVAREAPEVRSADIYSRFRDQVAIDAKNETDEDVLKSAKRFLSRN